MCSGLVQAGKSTFQNAFVAMFIIETKTQKLYEINPAKPHGENYMTCPVCSETRKKKREKCFVWNVDKQVGHCCHCNATFSAHMSLKSRQPKDYVIPVWKNKTELSDEAVKWFEGRMISQATIRDMRIYSDREWMPQFGKEVKVICFPYFIEGKLVNIKYRGPKKSFRMVKDAELTFYNFNCTSEAKDLIICEGEMDALSFIEAGFKNVVSVPNGAGATDLPYLDNYIDSLGHIERFYIATDFDDAGLKLRNELVRRLGSERCLIVTYKGRKDANELLIAEGGLAIREVIKNAQEIPIQGYIHLSDRYDDIFAMYQHGLPEGNRIGIAEIDETIRWEVSQLAIWTGIPSHGKSEMLDYIAVRLAVMHDWKTLFFSPENYPVENHYAKIAEKLIGKPFKESDMSRDEFDTVFDYIESHFFWLDPYEDPTLENVLSRAKQFIQRKGIKQVVMDPFNCMEHKRDRSETGSEYVGRFLDECSRFTKRYGILGHLVAHPTKLEKMQGGIYPPPTLYDISGSANFYNKADYGLTVYRDFVNHRTKLIPTKVRFKNFGHPSSEGIVLQYNPRNGRYQVPPGDINLLDNSNWLQPRQDGFQNDNTWTIDSDVPF
jgi:twinkle protein